MGGEICILCEKFFELAKDGKFWKTPVGRQMGSYLATSLPFPAPEAPFITVSLLLGVANSNPPYLSKIRRNRRR